MPLPSHDLNPVWPSGHEAAYGSLNHRVERHDQENATTGPLLSAGEIGPLPVSASVKGEWVFAVNTIASPFQVSRVPATH